MTGFAAAVAAPNGRRGLRSVQHFDDFIRHLAGAVFAFHLPGDACRCRMKTPAEHFAKLRRRGGYRVAVPVRG